MNYFALCRPLVRVTLVALSAASGFMLPGIGQVRPAYGQNQTVQGPAGGNPYGGGINSNPFSPGQQLILGAPVQPTQASRPAGWPGGPDADPPPKPIRRRKVAPPFKSNVPGTLTAGTAAAAGTATAAGTGAVPGVSQPTAAPFASVGVSTAGYPAAQAVSTAGYPAAQGVSTAGYPAAVNPVNGVPPLSSPPSGVQPAGNFSTEAAPVGTGATYAAPATAVPAGTGTAVPAAPAAAVAVTTPAAGSIPAEAVAAGGAPPAGAGPAGAGSNGAAPNGAVPRDPVLVASSLTGPIDPVIEEKKTPLPFGLPDKFSGAEIIAWVGPEPVLASDVLPDANRQLQKLLDRAPKLPPEDEIERARKLWMSRFLQHTIETKLVVVEGRRNLPKEAWGKIEKSFNEQFDKEYLKKMIDSEECRSRTELDIKLRKQGSSLEALRRQAMENSFAQHWVEEKVKDDHEITHEEMHAYYRAHLTQYETPARARWEHLMARYDKFKSKEEAWQAIAGWGREVQEGKPFGEVATAHSHDITAEDGGVHSWTNKDSLVSEVLDAALFSLPIGQLSQILEDQRGFHIIRVIERDDLTVTPFTDTQAEIRKKIRDERNNDKRKEYKEGLRKKIPVWNIFEEAAGVAAVAP